jgi:hypothetical protein
MRNRMPQAATSPTNGSPQAAIDPQKDPIAFAYENKEALSNMPPEKAIRFVDMLFRRFALPKYQKVNKQKPLDEDEVESLRTQFAARLFGLPAETTQLKDEKPKYGTGAKAAAVTEAAGAGVLGGIKTIAELQKKINEHLGPIGKPENYLLGKITPSIAKAEGKAYESAKEVAPQGAEVGAAIGHQIPATIASAGVGGVIPKLAEGAPAALKIASGAARGTAEGATYGASVPGGDAKSFATWGGVLGAAFPALKSLFGLGRSKLPSVAKAVTEIGESGATAEAPKTLGGMAEQAAKTKFGKSFKDLTPAERAQMPQYMKDEIKKQQVQKSAKLKAEKASLKAASEAEKTAQRDAKAELAKQKAAGQATKRAEGSVAKQAIAAQAATENPTIAKFTAGGEQRASEVQPMHPTEKAELEKRVGHPLTDEEANQARKKLAKWESNIALKEGKVDVASKENAGLKDSDAYYKIQNDPALSEKFNRMSGVEKQAEISRVKQEMRTTKVSEGTEGKKIRAKGGQPASPAQQAADRERIAKTREEAKHTEFGVALESKARELAGKYTSATQIGVQHIPELEEAVKEIPNGEVVLRGLQKMRRVGKITDEIYADSLKEWMMNQFQEPSSSGKVTLTQGIGHREISSLMKNLSEDIKNTRQDFRASGMGDISSKDALLEIFNTYDKNKKLLNQGQEIDMYAQKIISKVDKIFNELGIEGISGEDLEKELSGISKKSETIKMQGVTNKHIIMLMKELKQDIKEHTHSFEGISGEGMTIRQAFHDLLNTYREVKSGVDRHWMSQEIYEKVDKALKKVGLENISEEELEKELGRHKGSIN